MRRLTGLTAAVAAMLAISAAGCQSPHRSDQGALAGGVAGGVLGAIVGNQSGNSGAGAAIGAMTGMLAGSVIGNELDTIEAQNRAQIEARLGRPVGPGAVSISDVIAMSSAGIEDEVIAQHIRYHGVVAPLTTGDLITLKNANVSSRVVMAMQEPPRPQAVAVPAGGPVIVEEHYYPPPHYLGPPRGYHYVPVHEPRPSVNFSFGH